MRVKLDHFPASFGMNKKIVETTTWNTYEQRNAFFADHFTFTFIHKLVPHDFEGRPVALKNLLPTHLSGEYRFSPGKSVDSGWIHQIWSPKFWPTENDYWNPRFREFLMMVCWILKNLSPKNNYLVVSPKPFEKYAQCQIEFIFPSFGGAHSKKSLKAPPFGNRNFHKFSNFRSPIAVGIFVLQ